MVVHRKPLITRISREIGSLRTIRPSRARDEDLSLFLRLSERSLRLTARELDGMITPL